MSFVIGGQTRSHSKDLDVRGTDVSHQNGKIDWRRANADKIHFAFIKATDGIGYARVDYFYDNWPKMKAAGVLRGAYHFYEPKDDPIRQATYFADVLKRAGGLQAGDLPPVLDIEKDGGLGKSITPRILKFLEHLQKLTGRIPIIYVSPGFADSYFNDGRLAQYPLWVAEYGVESPRIPKVWKKAGKGWAIWQYSSRGRKADLNGTVIDLDVFQGHQDALTEFIRTSHVGATPKPPVTISNGADPSAKTPVVDKKTRVVSVATDPPKPEPKQKGSVSGQDVTITYKGATINVRSETTTETLEKIFRALDAAEAKQ